MSARRTDALAIIFLVALATLLFADVLFLGANFAFRDLFAYHFPMKRVVHDTIARGEFPWWNPMFGGGQPMAANPAYEIFYPPQWLIFIGSFEFGFALHVVAHVWIALIGMYLFLRALPVRPAAALFGSISFGLGGFLLGTATNLPTFFVWSWAGVVGWAVLALVREPSRRRFALATCALAMPLLVAEPVSIVQLWTLVLIGAVLVDPRAWRIVIGVAIAAALLASVQLIPMIDHARDSARARPLSYATVTDFSMPPIRPVEMLAPHAFGVIRADKSQMWGARFFAPRGGPYLLSLYPTIPIALLAIAGFFVLRPRGSLAVALVCAASYLLAIGFHTPLWRALYAAGLRSIRYPEKFIASAVVVLIIFSTVIADRLLAGDRRLSRAAAIVAAICAVAIAIASPASRLAAAFAAGWAVLFWFCRDARGWNLIAFALLVADVAAIGNTMLPRMPRAFFTPPPEVAAMEPGATLFHRADWLTHGGSDSPSTYARNALVPFTPSAWGLRTVLEADFDETELLPTHDLLDAMMRLGNSGYPRWSDPFVLMSNVQYVINANPRATLEHPIVITRVPNQGRYWFARELSRSRLHPGSALVDAPFTPAPARILDSRETSSSATLNVDASGTSFLVITITRHKYWEARIDGRAAPLVKANIAYQGLVVPAGHHTIELRYRNPLVPLSASVTLLTAIGLTVPIRRRRRLRNES